MERLMEDAVHVQNLLPWIESDEDIINFMRKIPLDKSHLRNPLTLRYFLMERDCNGDGFEKDIEDDAREIVVVLPGTSYKEIKDRLTIFGNMPNRKEAVLRQLLHQKPELNRIVSEIDSSCNKKRKSDVSNEAFDLNSNGNETNIKIKIRKIEGSLEVVSSIKENSPLKAASSTVQSIGKPSFSTTYSFPSSISQSDNSTPDSTVSVPIVETEGSSGIFPLSYHKGGTPTKILVKTQEEMTSENNLNEKDINIGDEPQFNLINSVHEVSQYPKHKIRELCHKYNMCERLTPDNFNFLLNQLYDNEIVESAKSDTSKSSESSETQEYNVDENLEQIGMIPKCENNSNTEPKQPNGKEFKLKEPVLNLGKSVITNALSLPKSTKQGNSSNSIIKPSRFHLPSEQERAEGNIIPAMPRPYLDRQKARESAAVQVPKPENNCSPIDLTSPQDKSSQFVNLDLDEAGPSTAPTQKARNVDELLVSRVIEMFPEACSEYIRGVCDEKTWDDFDDIVTVMLSAKDYPKRPQRVPSPVKEVDPEEQFQIVKELLPDADPDYLRMQCDKYANDDKGLKEFINQAVESNEYPTMKEYLRKQQLSAQQKQYTTEFSIDKFIELFPDPAKTFNDSSRVVKRGQMSSHYIVIFFRNKYTKISARTIQQVLLDNNYKVIPSNETFLMMMESSKNIMKSRRRPAPLPDNLQNIPLLQELAYIDHKKEIETYLINKQKKEEVERLEAKKNGLMQACQCCYDEEVMPKDTFSCPSGCQFCKDCIQKSCEVAFGEGKLVFPCLAHCSSEFTLQTLQNVLPPKMFSKIAQKKALEEIKSAGIEDLEMCPFCDFASIPNENDKIFRCLNPDCMKESCRLCKEPNHIPLKCEEVEKDEHVKARTHVEDAMTQALIRTCWKCGTSFFKEEGCNKMTCSCGAQMCYICKKPVKDYTHFNGIGGDKFHLCPLYSDTNLVNQNNVMKAAAAAKAQIDPSNLKVDPAADVETHYSNRRKQLPREPHLELVNARHQVIVAHHHRARHHHHHHHYNRHRHVGHVEQRQEPVVILEDALFPALEQQMNRLADFFAQRINDDNRN